MKRKYAAYFRWRFFFLSFFVSLFYFESSCNTSGFGSIFSATDPDASCDSCALPFQPRMKLKFPFPMRIPMGAVYISAGCITLGTRAGSLWLESHLYCNAQVLQRLLDVVATNITVNIQRSIFCLFLLLTNAVSVICPAGGSFSPLSQFLIFNAGSSHYTHLLTVNQLWVLL